MRVNLQDKDFGGIIPVRAKIIHYISEIHAIFGFVSMPLNRPSRWYTLFLITSEPAMK